MADGRDRRLQTRRMRSPKVALLKISMDSVQYNAEHYGINDYGGTTLNKPPIGLHVKILNFNGQFEAFSARYGMFLFHQPIQNR